MPIHELELIAKRLRRDCCQDGELPEAMLDALARLDAMADEPETAGADPVAVTSNSLPT